MFDKQWEIFNCPMGVKLLSLVQEGLKTNLLQCVIRVIVQEVLIICILAQEGLFNSYVKKYFIHYVKFK